MTGYEVSLTNDAVIDLEELDDYISSHDSPENADYVLDRIEEVIQGLGDMPERGSYPEELSQLGIKEYREVFFIFARGLRARFSPRPRPSGHRPAPGDDLSHQFARDHQV